MHVKVNLSFVSVTMFAAQVPACSVVTVSLFHMFPMDSLALALTAGAGEGAGGGSQWRLNFEISLFCKCNTFDFNKLQFESHKREEYKGIYFLNAPFNADSKSRFQDHGLSTT